MHTHNYFLIVDVNTEEGKQGLLLVKKDAPGGIITYTSLKEAENYFLLGALEAVFSDIPGLQTGAVLGYLQLSPFVVSFPINVEAEDVVSSLCQPDPVDPTLHRISSNAFKALHGIKINLESARKYKVTDVKLDFETKENTND